MSSTKRKYNNSPVTEKQCSSVNVFIRLRHSDSGPSIVKTSPQVVTTIPSDGTKKKSYKFTEVFDEDADQIRVFQTVARPMLDSLFISRKNGLIFTYGITGAGKTYTMEGGRDRGDGLIYRTFDYIFNSIGESQLPENSIRYDSNINNYEFRAYPALRDQEPDRLLPKPSVSKFLEERKKYRETNLVKVDKSYQYCVLLSVAEFYMKDKLRDLLSTDPKQQKLEVRSESYIAHLTQVEVRSADDAARWYKDARERRKISKTNLNDASSRGHLVLILRLARAKRDRKDTLEVAQICLVDLAGSERTKISGVSGSGMQETCSINNSLGVLRKCIMALRENRPAPYREDNLTKLFKNYFEGLGLVSMVLCVKPDIENLKENQYAMDFGTQTSDVKVDYASPPKQSKLQSNDLSLLDYIRNCKNKNKENVTRSKREYEIMIAAQKEFRTNLCQLVGDCENFKRRVDASEGKIKAREDIVVSLESQLKMLDDQNKKLRTNDIKNKRRIKELLAEVEDLADCQVKIKEIQKHVKTTPSAPSFPGMHTSSPIPGPSTSETTETHSDPLTNSSSETIDFNHHPMSSEPQSVPTKKHSKNGVPVVNPRHQRSLSCSGIHLQYIPKHTIKTGTIFKPSGVENGKTVRKLRSSDILRPDVVGYSVIHQDADQYGDVETRIYKGRVLPTSTGGIQCQLEDIEMMKQISPKIPRRRAASDVHCDN